MILTQPGKIGEMTLKNRMIMAPMGAALDAYGPRSSAYYLDRARGGAALILCNTQVSQAVEGVGPSAILNEQNCQQLADMISKAHEYDCKIGLQLHSGNGRISGPPPGRDKPIAASAVPWMDGRTMCDPLSIEEIRLIQEGFRQGVYYAGKAGADCIEIHAYGGYLTDQFLTKRWNVRQDKYGGSFERRLRYLDELIAIVQKELGQAFPLIIKFTPDHGLDPLEGYRALEEGLRIVKYLEQRGVHALHVDAGCHDNWHLAMPPVYQQQAAYQLKSAQAVRAAVSIPVISNGRLGDVGKAEAALKNGYLDFVAIGRGLLADPELPNKVLNHHTEAIRPCISCNEGCIAEICQNRPIGCALNPCTGNESSVIFNQAGSSKNILVVGAGPAGCSAAITAHLRGHHVTVWEKNEQIGGKLLAASAPIFKRDMARLPAYYERMLCSYEIPVLYGQEATLENVLAEKFDAVIWAGGAAPIRPQAILGIDRPQVVTAEEVLRNHCSLGESLAVIGGGLVGCETALHLESLGKRVILVEMQPEILSDNVFRQNKSMLTTMLNNSHIMLLSNRKLLRIGSESIYLVNGEISEEILCDQVVLAMGYRPERTIGDKIAAEIPLIVVGDARHPARIGEAVRAGFAAACSL